MRVGCENHEEWFMKNKIAFIVVLLAVVITGVVYCVMLKPFEENAEHDLFEVKEKLVPTIISDMQDEGEITSDGIENSAENDTEFTVKSDMITAVIYVHVCGAVAVPGVYELAKDSRVHDAIVVAGGFSDGAAEDYINLAGRLSDGQRIYIPFLDELVATDVTAVLTGIPVSEHTIQSSGTKIVNINTASLEELMTLPGIGAARAQSIIDYRVQSGGFEVREDIMKVTGIKEAMYDNLKDYITVD